MTDLLGVCTSWSDDACVVVPEDGAPVTIALADIVSGKPVPPRPSVRHRVSSREAEAHSLVMWPTVEVEPIGEWVLRTETRPVGRLLKRANSCLALGDPEVPEDEAVRRIRGFYAARDRDALVQVEKDTHPERWFAAAGWVEVPGGDAAFLIGSLARAIRACGRGHDPGLTLTEDGPRVTVELWVEGERVASGRAAYDGDWLGLHALEVLAAHRRRGLATALVRELLDWGAAAGARTAWLHVETSNHAALALYERLGFRTHHELRYLRAPDLEVPRAP